MRYPPANWLNNIQSLETTPQDSIEVQLLKELLMRDISDNSIKAIISDLKHFTQWYHHINYEPFEIKRLTEGDVIAYRRECESKQKPATINHRLLTIKAFCKLAVEEGIIKSNPAAKIKLLTLQPLAPKSLSAQELRKLLKETELRGKIRDRLIIELMAGAGLRVSELVNLELDDVVISERKGHLVIQNSKGLKTRLVPLNQKLRELFTSYFNENRVNNKIFLGQRGPLTNIAFNKIIGFYAKKAGIKCSPHMLRHTFSYNFLNQHPGEIVGLSQILGHSNLNTTAIYTQNRLEDLQEKVEAIAY